MAVPSRGANGVLDPGEVDAAAGEGALAGAVESDEVVKVEVNGRINDRVDEVSKGREFSMETTSTLICADDGGKLGIGHRGMSAMLERIREFHIRTF